MNFDIYKCKKNGWFFGLLVNKKNVFEYVFIVKRIINNYWY